MNLQVSPTSFHGHVTMPPSKSWAHRILLVSALAEGTSTILGLSSSEDTVATQHILQSLGARFENTHVTGPLVFDTHKPLDAKASGTTLRLLIPLLLTQSKSFLIVGKDRLPFRPIQPYIDAFQDQNITMVSEIEGQTLPLRIQGPLQPGRFRLQGDISSQFISGLLFALPLLAGDSVLEIEGESVSKPYIDITIATLRQAGVVIDQQGACYFIPGSQKYQPRRWLIEGDYSQAVFFLAGASLKGHLVVDGLTPNSLQGDAIIETIFSKIGGHLVRKGDALYVEQRVLKPMHVDVMHCPDIAPMLIGLAAFIDGDSSFENVKRLNVKESARLTAMTTYLSMWNVAYTLDENHLIVHGSRLNRLPPKTYPTFSDHRLVMMLAMLASVADAPYTIEGVEALNKSYPTFLADYKSIGGRCKKEGEN